MINRLLGIIFTVAALAAIVFAVLNYQNIRSLCFNKSDITAEEPIIEVPTPEVEEPILEIEPLSPETEAISNE